MPEAFAAVREGKREGGGEKEGRIEENCCFSSCRKRKRSWRARIAVPLPYANVQRERGGGEREERSQFCVQPSPIPSSVMRMPSRTKGKKSESFAKAQRAMRTGKGGTLAYQNKKDAIFRGWPGVIASGGKKKGRGEREGGGEM